MKKISVVILTSQGPRHVYFAQQLMKSFDVLGFVVDDRYRPWDRIRRFLQSNHYNPIEIYQNLQKKKRILPYEQRDQNLEKEYFKALGATGGLPKEVALHKTIDPNSQETVEWIREKNPDVIVAFGTRMIQSPVLQLARKGALNIHTGLSPHYRGGQCTFWCLYEGEPQYLGVTIHHLTKKIDGGDILYTGQTILQKGDTVKSIECRLVKIGTKLMVQAIHELDQGVAPRQPQTEKGKLFLSKMFTLEKRLELEKRLDEGLVDQFLNSPTGG